MHTPHTPGWMVQKVGAGRRPRALQQGTAERAAVEEKATVVGRAAVEEKATVMGRVVVEERAAVGGRAAVVERAAVGGKAAVVERAVVVVRAMVVVRSGSWSWRGVDRGPCRCGRHAGGLAAPRWRSRLQRWRRVRERKMILRSALR